MAEGVAAVHVARHLGRGLLEAFQADGAGAALLLRPLHTLQLFNGDGSQFATLQRVVVLNIEP